MVGYKWYISVKVGDKVSDKWQIKWGIKNVYVLIQISVDLDMLYEINEVDWGLRGVLWGYYIYGRDSVIIFDMGIYVGV